MSALPTAMSRPASPVVRAVAPNRLFQATALLIAVVMMLAQSTTFAEATAILPTTGSVYDYINCGMGRFFAITGTLSAYLIVHVFAGTAETILAGVMALVNFEHLNTLAESAGGSWLLGVAFVISFVICFAFNLRADKQQVARLQQALDKAQRWLGQRPPAPGAPSEADFLLIHDRGRTERGQRESRHR